MNFSISGGNKNASIKLTENTVEDILLINVSMTLPSPEIPEPFSISWYFSASDVHSTWNPSLLDIHGLAFDWSPLKVQSRLASWMPVQSLISKNGTNKLCIAVSDVDTPINIKTGIHEESASFICETEFFTRPTAPTDNYSATIRLDMRSVPYYDSIYSTVSWWETECNYKAAYVPDSAKAPVDSLWYSFHQMLDRDEIISECKASAAIGLETVIIDDGWQTDDNNRGYAYCGDWLVAPKKMGDMASLVEEIHRIGMKVMLWYSVPFVGKYTDKYNDFKNMVLEGSGNDTDFFGLDPRYKNVRDYLVETYKKAVKTWNLDGLKLDFIDSFFLKGKSLEYDERRDFQSLEDAIHALMTEVKTALTAINPDILIEFRQSYVGPSIRKYGNMLRVGDCPCDTLKNRTGVINLRLTSGKTAVHSDMIMWNMNDSAENAALQFANILYAVPQVSVRIDKLPEDHYKMLRYYISFWKKWKNVLLDGYLTAENPEIYYSQACSTLEEKSVITCFTNPIVTVKSKETAVVNASMYSSLIIKNAENKSFTTVNCKGETIEKGSFSAKIQEISIPAAGMIFIN